MTTDLSQTRRQRQSGATSRRASERGLTFVLHSSFPAYSGGRENWLFNLMGQLSGQGYAITVYSYDSDEPLFYDLLALEGVKVVRVPTLRGRASWFRLINRLTLNIAFWLDALVFARRTYRRLLDEWCGGPVIAMGPIVDLQPVLWFSRRQPDAPAVCSVRGLSAWEHSLRSPLTGPFILWAGPLLRWLERRSLARCDLVLANGFDTQEYLRARGIASTVVPNGVDVARFAAGKDDHSETEQLRKMRAEGKAILMMVATLRSVKGTYELLEAAKRLKSEGASPFVMVFVGKGEQGRYRLKARVLGVEDRVWFAGEQRDVAAFLALADVSVNLGAGAGMSMAVLESMAAGKAIVAWDTPTYRQLIEDGRTGALVKEGDAGALAERLARLMADPTYRRSLGSAARERAMAYDWSGVARRFQEALDPVQVGARP